MTPWAVILPHSVKGKVDALNSGKKKVLYENKAINNPFNSTPLPPELNISIKLFSLLHENKEKEQTALPVSHVAMVYFASPTCIKTSFAWPENKEPK